MTLTNVMAIAMRRVLEKDVDAFSEHDIISEKIDDDTPDEASQCDVATQCDVVSFHASGIRNLCMLPDPSICGELLL